MRLYQEWLRLVDPPWVMQQYLGLEGAFVVKPHQGRVLREITEL